MKLNCMPTQIARRLSKKTDFVTGKMNRCLILIGIIYLGCLMLLPAANCGAAEEGSVANVDLVLEPVIAVEAATPTISISHTGNSEIEITANFSVEANTKQVEMFVETTAFYLNGDITNPEATPILLLESSGVDIDPDGAILITGTNPAGFTGDGEPIEVYPTRKTATLTFESPDLAFNHSTAVTVTWDQDDPFKPAGHYYASIKLTCISELPE